MWGIIGHVTVEAGSPVGTDGAPPQLLLGFLTVLRIRDVYPGSDFFPSRFPDPNCLYPGSASNNLSILTPKNGF